MKFTTLDNLVAKFVMNWEEYECETYGGTTQSWKVKGGNPIFRGSSWSPTSDWRDTGQVLDKMVSLDYIGGIYVGDGKWQGAWFDPRLHKYPFAPTASYHTNLNIAICLAALAAVGVPQDVIDEAMKEQSNG